MISFLLNTFQSIFFLIFENWSKIKKIIKGLKIIRRFKFGYYWQLENLFLKMPFIYYNLSIKDELTIKDDYVNPILSYCPLMVGSDENKNYYETDDNSELSNELISCAIFEIRECKKLLIFGNAGIGKTSFTQHIVYNLINGKYRKKNEFIYESLTKLVPIFVPLKVLDSEEDSPILKYILKIEYFDGNYGRKRFLKLLEKKNILIILDGYDEIIIKEGVKNTIIEELQKMFVSPSTGNKNKYPDYFEYYRLINHFNRVWLSSRRHYFLENPLFFEESNKIINDNSEFYYNYFDYYNKNKIVNSDLVGSTYISGVQEKNKLINNLVRRYSNKNVPNCHIISQSGFWKFTDDNFGDDVKQFTNNPLFLTVLFYLYAKYVIDNKVIESNLSIKEVIDYCTKLLLTDIDEYKVRNIENKNIRNIFNAEVKLEYLRYIAHLVYVEPDLMRKNSFEEGKLYKLAEKWEDGLKYFPDKTIENVNKMIKELINQNYFIIVAEQDGIVFYDFPHRRFKEILALDYFNNKFTLLIEKIEDINYKELVVMFVASGNPKSIDIIKKILELIEFSLKGEKYETMLHECLNYTNVDLKFTEFDNYLFDFISRPIVKDIPKPILNKYELVNNNIVRIENILNIHLQEKELNEFNRIVSIYGLFNNNKMFDYLFNIMCNNVYEYDVICSIYEKLYNSDKFPDRNILMYNNIKEENLEYICNLSIDKLQINVLSHKIENIVNRISNKNKDIASKALLSGLFKVNKPNPLVNILFILNREDTISRVIQDYDRSQREKILKILKENSKDYDLNKYEYIKSRIIIK